MTTAPIRVRLGQHHLPAWDDFVADFEGIFERRFFANNGPLLVALDTRFGPFVGASEAVAVTNETIAVAIATRALGLTGEVAVPARANLALLQGLVYGGARPRLVDVDPDHEGLAVNALERCGASVCALGVVLSPRRPAVPAALEREAARRGVPLLVDASEALGCEVDGRPVGAAPHVHVFSFHSRHIVQGGEGAILTAPSRELADRMRFCRSFHAASESARVAPRINGKMAEAPAALIHRGLDALPARIGRNAATHARYVARLADVAGVRVLGPAPGVRSNHETLEVELSGADAARMAAEVVERLARVGIESARSYTPGELRLALGRAALADDVGPWPIAADLAARRVALPIGAAVDDTVVDEVTDCVRSVAQARRV